MDPMIANGEELPDFDLIDLDGVKRRLSDYRGHVVVLDFWSAECPWCARVDGELVPGLASLNGDVTLIAIAANAGEPLGLIQSTARDRGLNLVLLDAHQAVTRRYGVQITPHFFVADRTGALRYQGAFDDVTFRQRAATQNYLFQAVQAVLAGEEPHLAVSPAYGCAVTFLQEGGSA
jgi:peroxiredoxin